jgi:hypothetical protein
MTPKDLVKSLEKRGKAVGLKPADLAKLADVHPTTWWRIRKDRHKPQFETWERLQKLHKSLAEAA